MTRWVVARTPEGVARLLLPVLVLLAWAPTAASADTTASIGISVQVCTTAPHCGWEEGSDWASETALPSVIVGRAVAARGVRAAGEDLGHLGGRVTPYQWWWMCVSAGGSAAIGRGPEIRSAGPEMAGG